MQMNECQACLFDLIMPFLPVFSIGYYNFIYNIHATCTVRGRKYQLHMIITKLVIMRIINRVLTGIYELPFNNREINTNMKHTFKNSCIKETALAISWLYYFRTRLKRLFIISFYISPYKFLQSYLTNQRKITWTIYFFSHMW